MTAKQPSLFDFEDKSIPVKNLQLERPLVIFDLETTGVDIKNDRIVQFAFLKIHPDKTQDEWSELVNPGMPIPPEATQVHQITDDMVAGKPGFGDFAPHVFEFLDGCDLGGFNVVRFDVPFLQNEMTREGIPLDLKKFRIVDVQVIFHKKEPRDLSAALRFYCHKDHDEAHDALGDVRATVEILDAQLGRYPDLPPEPDKLHKYCNALDARWVTPDRKFYWRNKKAVISFGKHKGKSLQWLAENQNDYLLWMRDSDFPPETRELVRNALNGIFPQKQGDQD